MQIETGLFKRQGKAITNFSNTLPALQSDLAQEALKDPYNFDFLTLGTEAHERDIEQALVDHIQKFLIELGVGFAFVSRQYHLEVWSCRLKPNSPRRLLLPSKFTWRPHF
jgi:predicted nuclease of restriction endonuclease-like (RecB) superfamily